MFFELALAFPQKIHSTTDSLDAIIAGAVENEAICLVTHKKWMKIK